MDPLSRGLALLFALSLAAPGAAEEKAADPAKHVSKMAWAEPCSITYPNDRGRAFKAYISCSGEKGRSFGGETLRPACDFMVANQPNVVQTFNKLPYDIQRNYLEKNICDADKALSEYKTKKDAMIADSGKLPEKPQWLRRVVTAREKIEALERGAPPLAQPFGLGTLYASPPDYLAFEDFKRQVASLEKGIEADSKKLTEAEKKRADEAHARLNDRKKGTARGLDAFAASKADTRGKVETLFEKNRYRGEAAALANSKQPLFKDNSLAPKTLGTAGDFTSVTVKEAAVKDLPGSGEPPKAFVLGKEKPPRGLKPGDTVLFHEPKGGPPGAGDAGHSGIGFVLPDGSIVRRDAAWGGQNAMVHYPSVSSSKQGQADTELVVLPAYTKKDGTNSGDAVMDYMAAGKQRWHAVTYCSNYAADVIADGYGKDAGWGVTPTGVLSGVLQ